MKTFFDLREKTLTPAEKKKREEVAKAIERENPNMPMGKKMAIATATAKKVAEAKEDLSSVDNRRLSTIANDPNHPDKAAAKNELNRRRMQREEVELDEVSQDLLGRYNTKAAAKKSFGGDKDRSKYTNLSLSKRTGVAIGGQKAKVPATKTPKMEEVEQIDELSKKTLGSYVKGASASAAGIASGVGRDIGAGKKAHPDDTRQLRNRLKGVQKATDKLTNEAAFDDESKAHDRHYAKQTPAVQNALDKYTRQGMSYKQAHKKISDPLTGHRLRKEITPLHEENLDEVSAVKLGQYSAKAAQQGGDKRIAGQKMADEKIRKKYGYSSDAKVAAGSLPKKESVELDETTYQKARKIMKKRNQGMTRAFEN